MGAEWLENLNLPDHELKPGKPYERINADEHHSLFEYEADD